MSKKFNYTIGSHNIEVHAEQEGDSRFMVRMSCAGRLANVRIGYLTGAGRKWCGFRPIVTGHSEKGVTADSEAVTGDSDLIVTDLG